MKMNLSRGFDPPQLCHCSMSSGRPELVELPAVEYRRIRPMITFEPITLRISQKPCIRIETREWTLVFRMPVATEWPTNPGIFLNSFQPQG
jgi:hypothetical protein